MLVIAKILRHGQGRVADTKTTAGQLVHLAEYHHHVRQYPGLLHFTVKLLAFTTALADTTENAHALVVPDHVVNHFGEQHCLTDTCATEQPCLAATLQGRQHIDDFYAGDKDFRFCGTALQRWRGLVHRTPLNICKLCAKIDGMSENIEHTR